MSNVLKIYGLGLAIDIATNPFQMMENRHILQSGIP